MDGRGDFDDLSRIMSAASGSPLERAPVRRVGGGCINECFEWRSKSGSRFVKLGPPARIAMFEAEADSLHALAKSGGCSASTADASAIPTSAAAPCAHR